MNKDNSVTQEEALLDDKYFPPDNEKYEAYELPTPVPRKKAAKETS